MALSSARTTFSATLKALGPYWIFGPIALGVAVFVVVALAAPAVQQDSPPEWFAVAFPAAIVVILLSLGGLAAGDAKLGNTKVGPAILAYTFYLAGVLASLAGLDTTLDAWTYKFLLGLSAGACVGSLTTTIAVGVKALRTARQKAAGENLAALAQRRGEPAATKTPTEAPTPPKKVRSKRARTHRRDGS